MRLLPGSSLARAFVVPVAWWLCAVTAHAATAAGEFPSGNRPDNASIQQLQDALEAGRTTSVQLVHYYLERIERFDKHGPHINALISLNPEALEQAKRADEGRGHAAHRGPLYGIPFIVKDNFDSAGIPTSGGSAALRDSVPTTNSFVLQRLIEQGAVLIGKANMSELAASYGRLGYSSAGGLTANPFNTARDVSGSSSGSAAAVASGFSAFALGTDTSGSIRGPASVAGLVGVRPTFGLASRSGIIPLSLTFDTPGVLAHSVEDAAVVLDAISGPDPEDAATLSQPARGGSAAALAHASLRGVRLGVVTNFRGGNAEVDAVEQRALSVLAARGAVLVPITLGTVFDNLWKPVLGPVGEAEFKPQFERYLRSLPATQPQTLAQLIAISASPSIVGSATPVNPARLDALRRADATKLTDSPTYIHILTQLIPSLREQLRATIAANELQALVFATLSCPATPRFDRPDPTYVCHSADPYRASYLASAAGFPEVTVPVGVISENLPVGYSLMGLPDEDAQLLALASAFQHALPGPPQAELR